MIRKLCAGALVVAAIAAGAGCGGDSTSAAPETTTEASPAAASTATNTAPIFDATCVAELQPLAETLSDLDSRLGVGLNFEAYSERVGDVNVAYEQVEFGDLDDACVRGPGLQLEKAVNSYVRAYRVWNTCISDIDCSNDSIRGLLRQHWARATRQVTNAQLMLEVGG